MEDLYRQYYQELCAWCCSMTKNLSMAEDLVQEAFLRAMTSWEVFGSLRSSQQRAWLYRTVRNLFVDGMRHAAFETALDESFAETRESEDYQNIDIALFLGILPEEEKLLFVMRYMQGYNSAELGKLFGMSSGTVRSKLSSARKRLRDALKEGQKGEGHV